MLLLLLLLLFLLLLVLLLLSSAPYSLLDGLTQLLSCRKFALFNCNR
jgi:hypothetical protein